MEKREAITTTEAGRMMLVSRETAKRMFERGEIEGFRTSASGHVRLYRDSVLRYIETRSRPHREK